MENNNGRGIFYGVIGVATLVVAIIGATFAYFSAQTNSDVNAITTGGANVSLGWTEEDSGIKSNLVPVNAQDENFGKYVGLSETDDCIDDNGNNICSVYQYTVNNPGNAGQTVYASLKVNTNDFTVDPNSNETNLKFAIFKGAAASIASYDFSANAVATTGAAAGAMVVGPTSIEGTTEIPLTNLTELIGGGQSVTYTVVLWIQETGKEQNQDQGDSFAGGIFYTTASGSDTGITGMLSA